MDQVSRPMQILLAATVLLGAVWFLALRPKGGGEVAPPAPTAAQAPDAPGAQGLTTAVGKAQGAVGTANGAAQQAAGEQTATPGGATTRVHAVRVALRHHRAVAIAFVSPQIADARAVAVEIRHVSRFHGRAVALAVPIGQLSAFDLITRDVQVTTAPTTVIVDRNGEATTIVGFADRVEIQQRLADALAVKRR